jgi:isochorismate synthase EntC
VVTAIKQALRPLCEPLTVQARPRLRHLADMIHLETPIRASLVAGEHVLSLTHRLHPTPAVGGHPQHESLQWLASHEPVSRGWYASPVGWVGPSGDGVFAVALRSGLIDDRWATAFVGAGIVGDSLPHAEWRETELKLRTFCDALSTVPEVR